MLDLTECAPESDDEILVDDPQRLFRAGRADGQNNIVGVAAHADRHVALRQIGAQLDCVVIAAKRIVGIGL